MEFTTDLIVQIVSLGASGIAMGWAYLRRRKILRAVKRLASKHRSMAQPKDRGGK